MDRKTFSGMVSVWKTWVEEIPAPEEMHPVLCKGFVLKAIPEWALEVSTPISKLWMPDLKVETKLEVLRLMAAALKAHYFLFKRDTLSAEPVCIPLPDVNRHNQVRLVLLYPFFGAKKALMVSRADMALISSGKVGLLRFPVVVPPQMSDWVNLEHWGKLEKKGSWLRAIRAKEGGASENKIAAWSEKKTFPFGTLFEGLSESGERALRECGGRWAPGVNCWYLPLGFDVSPVADYLHWTETSRANLEEFGADIFSFLE